MTEKVRQIMQERFGCDKLISVAICAAHPLADGVLLKDGQRYVFSVEE